MRSEAVIRKKHIQLKNARLAYVEKGDGRPVVFLHGIPTSSFLWRGVLEVVSNHFKCYALDLLGMGDTEVGLDQDYSMPAQAETVFQFFTELGISSAAVVGHDQGGACAQIFATGHREVTTHLVLVNSVAYDNWPVPEVRRLQRLMKIPLFVWMFDVAVSMTPFFVGKFMLRNIVYDRSVLREEVVREYARAIGANRRKRRKFRKFVLSGDNRYTQEVAKKLKEFDHPTMIVWGEEDPFLPVAWARRLCEGIQGATRLELIAGAGHLLPEEKPEILGDLIVDFLRSEKRNPPCEKRNGIS